MHHLPRGDPRRGETGHPKKLCVKIHDTGNYIVYQVEYMITSCVQNIWDYENMYMKLEYVVTLYSINYFVLTINDQHTVITHN